MTPEAPLKHKPQSRPAFLTRTTLLVTAGLLLLLAIGAGVGTTLLLKQRGQSQKGTRKVTAPSQTAAGTATAATPPPGQGQFKYSGPVHCDRRLLPSANATQSRIPATAGTSQWTCRVYTSEGVGTTLDALLTALDPNSTQLGTTTDLSTFASQPWTREQGRPATGGTTPNVTTLGIVYEGFVDIPEATPPDFLALQIKPDALVDQEYIHRIEIFNQDATAGWEICIAPNTWVHKTQGSRVFPTHSQAYLPSDTPQHLVAWRASELAAIKGTPEQQQAERQVGDRVYDYDVFNDLAGVDPLTRKVYDRPVLGGSTEYPYPRRIRTGRARVAGPNGSLVYETRETATDKFWVPLDDRYNTLADTSYKTNGMRAFLPTLTAGIRRRLFDPNRTLSTFDEVDDMYDGSGKNGTKASPVRLLPGPKHPKSKLPKAKPHTTTRKQPTPALKPSAPTPKPRAASRKHLGTATAALPGKDIMGSILKVVGSGYSKVQALTQQAEQGTKFPEALVQKGREGVWVTDTEFGRQALAGVNPSVVRAATSMADLGNITAAHLKGLIETYPVEVLLGLGRSKPRLLVIDHTAVFRQYAERITKQGPGRHGYWGRCLLFQTKAGFWRPVAIELQGWGDRASTVYTPTDPKYVWLLAKGVFLSLDTSVHQLVTHWLRSHACTEPYIIATHRALSALHPVYKLVMPHWRFTLNINMYARNVLVNANGIVEKGFTPGRYAMEMSSKVYGAQWRFNKQGLPADLISRGLAKKDSKGKLKLLLDDYPYADDGMLIWDALHEWVGQYLRLYYDDSDPKKSVTSDSEIMAWWEEIRTKGHADIKEGWPDLETVVDLTEILTTMIWVASGHHAAVNFAQYGYTGYWLNRPAVCTKPIPKKGTPEYEALVASEEAGQKAYIDTLHNGGTGDVLVTLQLLSSHLENEAYLGDPDHAYILDQKALKVHDKFVQRIRAAEKTMERRNRSKRLKLRHALAYELLMPTSGPGITNRGVPESTSI